MNQAVDAVRSMDRSGLPLLMARLRAAYLGVRPGQGVYTYDDIYGSLPRERRVEVKDLTPERSLFDGLGVDGDDFSELINAFAHRFNVEMSRYRWHFHHGEEGFNS